LKGKGAKMCGVCSGNSPTEKQYYHLRNQAKALLDKWSKRGDAATNPTFVAEVVELDNVRLGTGAGWGNPGYLGKPIQLIFGNPDAKKGLLLFAVCIWMSYRVKAETVWTRYLDQADGWISGRRSAPPQHRWPNSVTPHLNKIRDMAINSGSIANWFADAIVAIGNSPSGQPGNIYRMAGCLFRDLLAASQQRKRNTQGQEQLLAGKPGLLDWKRLWVLLMYLRRDNSLVRCLFERALNGVNGGQKALGYWYDDKYLDPKECQLPVDKWVKENWIELMSGSAFSSRQQLEAVADAVKPRVVAEQAKALAGHHDVSPSAFDVLFLAKE
jgi:hypothetical protein